MIYLLDFLKEMIFIYRVNNLNQLELIEACDFQFKKVEIPRYLNPLDGYVKQGSLLVSSTFNGGDLIKTPGWKYADSIGDLLWYVTPLDFEVVLMIYRKDEILKEKTEEQWNWRIKEILNLIKIAKELPIEKAALKFLDELYDLNHSDNKNITPYVIDMINRALSKEKKTEKVPC